MFLGIHLEKPRSRIPKTLSYSKGVPLARDPGCKGSTTEAIALLKSQNGVLNKDRLVELTYGPKRPDIEKFTPHWAKMDSKVLCFDGIIKETVDDWPSETHRIRYVKVYYYLENDTLRVVEPETPNSMLYQGTLLRRDRYLHPNRSRDYSWRDLNIGNDLSIHGKEIHLIDCDAWTKEYLTLAGIDMRDPEPKLTDPYTEMRKNMSRRRECRGTDVESASTLNFYRNDGKVLKFYGIWKSDPQRPPAVRRILLKYYLVDDTLAVFENYPPSSGWGPLLSALQGPMDTASSGGSFMTLIRRQRVLLDRPKDVDKLPCYLEPRDIDDVTWIEPEHLKTGEDMMILGKTFFLAKTDEFTRHYYREQFGVELPQIEVMEKPKPLPSKIIPPHGIGKPEETLQDCFKPYSQPPKRIHHPIPPKPAEIVNTVLRFAAKMDTPRDTERIRRFTISFFMEDDTVKVHEEHVPNSGFGSGTFLKRGRLQKEVETPVAKDVFYEAKDFHVGAKIKANGCTFVLTDADQLAFKFMENHPEIFTDICSEDQMKLADTLNGRKGLPYAEKMRLLEQVRNAVVMNHGCRAYPIEAIPDLGSGLAFKNIVLERLYSGNLPIPQELLQRVLCFDGIIKETVDDWPSETHRIRYVKVYYYLENDTLRVVEPETPNSMLYQGTLLRRDRYSHPNRSRDYSWRDLNIGNDLSVHGKEIHLIDCDAWTREYLTLAGIDMRDPEPKPTDPYTEMRKNMSRRRECRGTDVESASTLNFYRNDGKVLKFYGIWKNDPQRPPAVRRILLKYYLVDDTLAVFENYPPSSGWGPLLSALQGPMDTASSGGSFMTLIRRQRVLLDRPEDVDKLPCYLEPRDIDDVTWIEPEHLKTGEDMMILGKTFFLAKTDEFTRHYYREHFGVELPQIEVMEKPKPLPSKIIPPHGIGKPEETLQDCFKPYSQPPKRIHHPIPPKPAEIVNTVLRFAAKMDTPRDTERIRRFTISFFMEDDTVKVHEEHVPNSGFGSGTFLKRGRLQKEVETPVAKDVFYEAKDFHVGAKIKANGCTFVLTDADQLAFKFMENHPEIFTDICVEDQMKLADTLNGRKGLPYAEKMRLLEQVRNAVVMNHGCRAYPIEAIPDLGSGLAFKNIVLERLYSGNLPIPQELLQRLVDAFAFEERTNVDEIRTFLLVALGHNKDHSK